MYRNMEMCKKSDFEDNILKLEMYGQSEFYCHQTLVPNANTFSATVQGYMYTCIKQEENVNKVKMSKQFCKKACQDLMSSKHIQDLWFKV